MIDPRNLDSLLHPTFDQKALKAATPIAKALGAAPGAACGKIVFTADAVSYPHLDVYKRQLPDLGSFRTSGRFL